MTANAKSVINAAGNRQSAVEELPSMYHYPRIGMEPTVASPGTTTASLKTAPEAAAQGCYLKGDKEEYPSTALDAPAGYCKGNVGLRQAPVVVTDGKASTILKIRIG